MDLFINSALHCTKLCYWNFTTDIVEIPTQDAHTGTVVPNFTFVIDQPFNAMCALPEYLWPEYQMVSQLKYSIPKTFQFSKPAYVALTPIITSRQFLCQQTLHCRCLSGRSPRQPPDIWIHYTTHTFIVLTITITGLVGLLKLFFKHK